MSKRTEADIYRSTPGHVYSVGSHSDGKQEPYTPKCSCPCHLAEIPGPTSFICDQCWQCIVVASWPEKPRLDYSHADAKKDGLEKPKQPMRHVTDYYFITKGNTLSDELNEHFPTLEKAQARADELNEGDVIASLELGPEAEKRLRAFRELVKGQFSWAGEYWWARKPGRYAIETDDDGGTCWATVKSLAAVEEEVRTDYQTVYRVVDLDTGEDVPFTREVSVSVG